MLRKKITFILILYLYCCMSCGNSNVEKLTPQIIPVPDSIQLQEGYFILSNTTVINYSEAFEIPGKFLKDVINWFVTLNIYGESNEISFVYDNTIYSDEAYILDIKTEKIEIRARNSKGAFYAVQTLRQLLPHEFENDKFKQEATKIPCVTIKDQPQFKYRGMHLDVGRHMYSVDFIKKYIDAMAMLKLNTFHWHLTEDQGWRIEIKKYPKLQEIAAYRDETLVGHYNDQPHQFDGKRYGGYYTQEEIKDIVAYAKERFITIIPEIEMPGHSQAAIAAYPELGCSGEQVEVAKKWGVFEHIYCPKEATFAFLEDVLDEVMDLFPSKYIHIGGDEAPKTAWENSPYCQALIKKEGLKDEHELQNYFITRIEKYLNAKGRQIIGWDEILEGGLAPNASVMSWRGTKGAVEAAKAGHNVVMTPTSHCYFDYYQSENEDEPLAIGGFLPLEKVYNFNPTPEELTDDEIQHVLGAQGNIWTEYMPVEDQVEYMAFPRMLAMSEVVWSNPEQKNYADFVSRVEHFHKHLDALDINYANHLYEVEGRMISQKGSTFYELSTLTKSKQIRYTLDGTEPKLTSKIYTESIPITESTHLQAAVFDHEKQLGRLFSQRINYHKAVGAKITIDKLPHKAYSGSGEEGLINGINGSNTRYGDKEWLGFWGDDIEIIIDLGKDTAINSIETRFYNGNGQWIYAPKHIAMRAILENNDVVANKILVNEGQKSNIIKASILFTETKPIIVKQIQLIIPNYGTIPEGKQGAGHKAWTFIDEIIIN